jgi:UDP-GlcNAc:undecaprenyl-phosphate GlcNAc-1-phosphate transferase
VSLAERLPISLLLAAGVVYAATPYAIRLAGRLQFYDAPVGYKGHAHPTPYLGGAAVMGGFVIAVLRDRRRPAKSAPLDRRRRAAMGGRDDRRSPDRPHQCGASWPSLPSRWMVWAVGVRLAPARRCAGRSRRHLRCGSSRIVNAFNLFDNMDGAASTMALVVAAGAALLGIIRGEAWLAVAAAALGGACVGFLPRNISKPARIFLGDGGSMPLGFAVAVIVMVAATTSVVAWQSLLIALLLVAIPALDTTLVIVSRRRRGAPVMSGGLDHLTHRTRRFLPSARAVALALGAVQAAVSLVAVMASQGGASFVVVGAILYLLAGGCAIALLDTGRMGAPTGLSVSRPNVAAAPPTPTRERSAARLILMALGLGAGLSPFFFAYYASSVWVPIGLGLVLASVVALVGAPTAPPARPRSRSVVCWAWAFGRWLLPRGPNRSRTPW